MTGDTVLLVRHMPGERDDRMARELRGRGYRLETCWVAEGQPLPAPDARFAAAVVYGGSQMASEAEAIAYLSEELRWIGRWLESGRPYLGICLGAQMLARALGAKVEKHPEGLSEIGYVEVTPTAAGRAVIPHGLNVYHWHREGFELPAGCELLATGAVFPNQAFRLDGQVFGLQFHPEVTLEMMASWMDKAGHMLAEPGAQPRAQQLAAARRYHEPLGAWLTRFIDTWLPPASRGG